MYNQIIIILKKVNEVKKPNINENEIEAALYKIKLTRIQKCDKNEINKQGSR